MDSCCELINCISACTIASSVRIDDDTPRGDQFASVGVLGVHLRHERIPEPCHCSLMAGYLAYVGYYCLSAGASLASGVEVCLARLSYILEFETIVWYSVGLEHIP